jgi:hypothetical protein
MMILARSCCPEPVEGPWSRSASLAASQARKYSPISRARRTNNAATDASSSQAPAESRAAPAVALLSTIDRIPRSCQISRSWRLLAGPLPRSSAIAALSVISYEETSLAPELSRDCVDSFGSAPPPCFPTFFASPATSVRR